MLVEVEVEDKEVKMVCQRHMEQYKMEWIQLKLQVVEEVHMT